jgi:TPR repeat protein
MRCLFTALLISLLACACNPTGPLIAPRRTQQLSASNETSQLAQQCNNGDARACTRLGFGYETGKHGRDGSFIPQDFQSAAAYYKRGCEGGHMAGCRDLGRLYQEGKGVPQDFTVAAQLYTMACDRVMDDGACVLLASLYRDGRGVPLDREKAVAMYREACRRGYEISCKFLPLVIGTQQHVNGPPPVGALGFAFGISSAEALKSCAGMDGTWIQLASRPQCTANYRAIGGHASVLLHFQDDRLVGLSLFRPAGQQPGPAFEEYERLQKALGGIYGIPSFITANVPIECEFIACLKSKRIKVEQSWNWEAGHYVMISMTSVGDSAEVLILYSHPDRKVPPMGL